MDKELFDKAVDESGLSITQICKKLGMSRSAFFRKRTGESEFTWSEIEKLVDILGLKSPVPVFFKEKVS
ncbi:MAG: helix-turn-helix transcriptional regulator [Oscillospiraceae bacterium]|nr:helix-turn-helix transcriptional regulator [Oscillospiraceae bacterium]MBR3953671.1 helix-turn-helix transcriptional regulator [Oscillospiraceae bacterium]